MAGRAVVWPGGTLRERRREGQSVLDVGIGVDVGRGWGESSGGRSGGKFVESVRGAFAQGRGEGR